MSDLLPHGPPASAAKSDCTGNVSHDLLLHPILWMKDQIKATEGKLIDKLELHNSWVTIAVVISGYNKLFPHQYRIKTTPSDISGKLLCPNPTCDKELGDFDWLGTKCKCGTWVIASFRLHDVEILYLWLEFTQLFWFHTDWPKYRSKLVHLILFGYFSFVSLLLIQKKKNKKKKQRLTRGTQIYSASFAFSNLNVENRWKSGK